MTETSRNQGFLLTKRRGVLSAFAVLLAVILLAVLTTASVVAQGPPSGDTGTCTNETVIFDAEDDRFTELVKDCQALLKLIEDDEITGRPATDALNWNEDTNIFNWVGVTIKPGAGSGSSNARRVTGLTLVSGTVSSGRGETFAGRIETGPSVASFTITRTLTGTLPSALGDLAGLTSLDIACRNIDADNADTLCNTLTITDGLLTMGLHGSIPDDLGKLTNLRFLQLQGNRLTGSIPDELGSLNALERVWLQGNYRLDPGDEETTDDDEIVGGLDGSIPAELGNLNALEYLSLAKNDLSGAIPETLGNLANLIWLYLSENDLDDSIPATLGNLGKLKRLHLEKQRGDKLTGNIPDLSGLSENLEELYLNGNKLAGEIPSSITSLGALKKLYLNDNKLTGVIPENLRNLRDVTHVDLRNNEFSGCISNNVVEWAGDPGPEQTNDRHVNRDGEGATDIELDTVLNLPNCSSECSITGAAIASVVSAQQDTPIDALALNTQCNYLYDLKEELEGEDNNVLTNWTGRTPLFRWWGVEFGEHPDGTTTGLFVTKLDLSDENLREEGATGNLGGSIPSDLRNLAGLQELHLQGNQLTDRIPNLDALDYLEVLDLSNNQLSGRIPDSLGTLDRGTGNNGGAALKELRLNNNRLTGSIPEELGDLTGTDGDGDAISLEVLDLSNNQLEGALPAAFEKLTKLKTLQLKDNQLTGGIPDEWTNGDDDDLKILETLDLSGNQMSDNLSPALQELDKLKVLRLNNQKANSEAERDGFEGPIPSQLGGLFRLQELDLSDNNFVGLLPEEFKNLSSLRILRLSNNTLAGTVPERLGVLAQVNLEEIKLSGNRFSGCLPREFNDVENNDFDMFDPALTFCGAAPVATPTPVAPTPTPTPMPPSGSEQLFLPLVRG